MKLVTVQAQVTNALSLPSAPLDLALESAPFYEQFHFIVHSSRSRTRSLKTSLVLGSQN